MRRRRAFVSLLLMLAASSATSRPARADEDSPPNGPPATWDAHHPTLELPPSSAAKALKDLKLPDEPPPPPANEAALQVGWNSEAPVGVRYLRHIPATWFAFGAGFGAFTIWGPKVSAIIRMEPDVANGFFIQASAGFTTGNAFTQKFATPTGEQVAHLYRTPGKTIDPMVGWRFRWGARSFIEAAAGYSFNLSGTVLQDPSLSHVPIDAKQIVFDRAGGGAAQISYGWLF